MALDNFNREAALNAVVEAWTQKGSAPFITFVDIGAGASKRFQVQTAFNAVMYIFGNDSGLNGQKQIFMTTANGMIVAPIYGAASISVTNSGNIITVKNNASRGALVHIVSLLGMCEEV